MQSITSAIHNPRYEAAVIYNYAVRVINFVLIFGNNSFLQFASQTSAC
jgi:hypothetical protein